MKLTSLDWAIIALYMVASLLIGLYYSRRASKSTNEFFLSGRNLPWWLAGTSMVATTFSSDTPLYVTGLVRGYGIYENWQWWCFIFSGMLALSFFTRLWRRANVVTDVELISLRYSGRSADVLRGFKAVYFSCIIHTIIKAQVILAMAKILDVTLGWGKWESILISSGITIAYAAMSGLWGVVVTDFFQFIIAMAGAIALAVISVDKVGGIKSLVTSLPADKLSFFPPGEFLGTAFMAFLGYVGLSWWSKYSSDGGGVVVQRISSCKDERHGYIAVFFYNAANYALRTWPWILAALASLILYPTMTDHEAVYPMMVVDLLPPGLAGLMLASFFAAFMSTMSTYLNLSSAYFVNDCYRPYMKPGRSDEHYVMVSRVSTLALSVLTAIVTYYATSIVDVFKFLIAFGSGTGLLYIVRWLWWRVNAWSEITATVVSSIMTTLMYTVYKDTPYHTKLALIILVSNLAWVVVTLLTRPVEIEKLKGFVRAVRPTGPGWRAVREAMGPEEALKYKGEGMRDTLLDWFAGSMFVLGLTIGIGKALLGYGWPAFAWLTLSAAATLVIRAQLNNKTK